ncbi:MAG TPA: hypothetical protein VNA31_04125 [bacterium]|nr:hypothetical protein [bacterium]
MKAQRIAIVLTAINCLLLVVTLLQTRPTTAQTVPPVLRANALELVDEHNVVRARLGVKGSNGPMELDLSDNDGIIHVKLGAANKDSGVASGYLVVADGGIDPSSGSVIQTYVQVIARLGVGTAERPTTRVMLKGADGRERVITP